MTFAAVAGRGAAAASAAMARELRNSGSRPTPSRELAVRARKRRRESSPARRKGSLMIGLLEEEELRRIDEREDQVFHGVEAFGAGCRPRRLLLFRWKPGEQRLERRA